MTSKPCRGIEAGGTGLGRLRVASASAAPEVSPGVCPRCSHANRADSQYCSRCGAEISAASAVRERRHLTILFCDLVESTRLSTTLDAEDLGAVLRAYQQACVDVIE